MNKIRSGSLLLGFVLFAGGLRADDQPTGTAVIDKALKAMGGSEKLARLKAGTWKFHLVVGEADRQKTLSGDAAWQGNNQMRLDGMMTEGNVSHQILVVINGDMGWLKKDADVRDAGEPMLSIIKDSMYAMRLVHWLPQLKDPAFSLSSASAQNVNGKEADGLSVGHPDHKPVNVYFDKDTGLPVKSEVRLMDPNGKEITVEHYYDDFKETDGLKQPMKITTKADGNEFVLTINEIQMKDKLEDSLFARPQ